MDNVPHRKVFSSWYLSYGNHITRQDMKHETNFNSSFPSPPTESFLPSFPSFLLRELMIMTRHDTVQVRVLEYATRKMVHSGYFFAHLAPSHPFMPHVLYRIHRYLTLLTYPSIYPPYQKLAISKHRSISKVDSDKMSRTSNMVPSFNTLSRHPRQGLPT